METVFNPTSEAVDRSGEISSPNGPASARSAAANEAGRVRSWEAKRYQIFLTGSVVTLVLLALFGFFVVLS